MDTDKKVAEPDSNIVSLSQYREHKKAQKQKKDEAAALKAILARADKLDW